MGDGVVRDEAGGVMLHLGEPLRVLDAGLIAVIDRYLAQIAGYGEVRLKVVQGRVRFVEVVVSVDVQKVIQTV